MSKRYLHGLGWAAVGVAWLLFAYGNWTYLTPRWGAQLLAAAQILLGLGFLAMAVRRLLAAPPKAGPDRTGVQTPRP
jgi:hypothetical protein